MSGFESVDLSTSGIESNNSTDDPDEPVIDPDESKADAHEPTVNSNTPTVDKLLCLGTTFHSKNVSIPSLSHL